MAGLVKIQPIDMACGGTLLPGPAPIDIFHPTHATGGSLPRQHAVHVVRPQVCIALDLHAGNRAISTDGVREKCQYDLSGLRGGRA
jgi:hypothetical protein